MRQKMKVTNLLDDKGNPKGGMVEGVGLAISWQNGPLGRVKNSQYENGTFVESVIDAAICRLKFFQDSKFKCRENSLAITKLEEALHWLDHRTKDRIDRGVEGTYEI